MKTTKFIFLAALLCGVANTVWAQAPTPAGAPATAPAGSTLVEVEVAGQTKTAIVPPGGSATVTVTYRGKDKKTSGSMPLKAQKYKERNGHHEETFVVLTCKHFEGTAGTANYRCAEWNEERFSTPEEIEKALAAAKAHTDQAVAAVQLPVITQLEGDKLMTRVVLPGSSCPVNQLESTGSGNFRCKVAMASEMSDPVQMARAQSDRLRALESRAAQTMRKPDDASQRTEVMLGGGAMAFLGSVDAGGPVAMLDFLVDAKGSVVSPTFHLAGGEFSDGQGLTGCAAVGGVKPFESGGATTVGLLAGWCETANADLARTDFPHADVQVRHRVWDKRVVLGLDFLAGVMLAQRVVNQAVVDDKSPEFGALFSASVNLGELF